MTKRPPGLWVLLSAGVLWLSMQDVYGIRATSLIFGKTTTTTTTTEQSVASEEEVATTEVPAESNSTKPILTGNPQIDYIWDPNLPKELNGYNLSDYPFYERVPEDIDFKCDGLHDGFYASVKHKCQVYHHCLFGTRYDFLCANYTAFDQTLFNCNFVSNADCQNSKKFWHRNDELYKTQSTTTQAPVVYNFYTPPPNVYARTAHPTFQVSPDQGSQQGGAPQAPPISSQQFPGVAQQPPVFALGPVEPKRRARPVGRRRPQYDYYDDDDYEERPIMIRRKRPRPRPVYYDDYEEYDDDRFDRRGSGRRRRPYERRPMRRDKDRRRKDGYEDEEEVHEDDVTSDKKPKGNRRKFQDDYDEEVERRDRYDKRRVGNRQSEKPPRKIKRPIDDYDDYEDTYDRRKTDLGKRRAQTDDDDARKKPRLGVRRPPSEQYEDDLQQADEVKSYDRSRKSHKESIYRKPQDETRAVIKPASGTIYDRPRLAPKINLPVPKNAADKFAYKSISSQAVMATKREEIDAEISEEDHSDSPPRAYKRSKQESSPRDVHRSIRRRPVAETEKPTTTTTTTTTTTITTEAPSSPSPVVRKFKRPFLPSRGGNPYSARSLEPLGEKALDKQHNSYTNDDEIQEGRTDTIRPPFRVKISTTESAVVSEEPRSGPMRIKVPIRVKATTEISQHYQPTETRKLSEADILNQNYDVSLNEALSPILPNLPIRSYPTGFSSSNDYIYNNRFPKASKFTFLDTDGTYYVR